MSCTWQNSLLLGQRDGSTITKSIRCCERPEFSFYHSQTYAQLQLRGAGFDALCWTPPEPHMHTHIHIIKNKIKLKKRKKEKKSSLLEKEKECSREVWDAGVIPRAAEQEETSPFYNVYKTLYVM